MRRAGYRLCSAGKTSSPLLIGQDGFTILEVLVTLVLVAFTSAGLGIALQSAAKRSNLDQGLSTLRQMAALARAEAINSGDTTVLTIDLARSVLSIGALSRRIELPADVSLRVITAREVAQGSQAAVAFFPDGSSSGAEFWLTSGPLSARTALRWQNGRLHDVQ